jgi:succinoglycan biosynthesis transport protein ExoP
MEQNPKDLMLRPSSPPPGAMEPAYPNGSESSARYPGNPAEEAQGGLIEYWRILRRRKRTVLAVALAGLLAGALITLPETPIYQARTSLEIQDMNQDFMNMKSINPVSDSAQYSGLADIQTQIKILQSETLSERTVAKLRAGHPASPEAESASLLQNLLSHRKPTWETALKQAARNMKVRAAGQTRIIELLVDSTDPRVAAAFANTITNEFIEQNMEARWQMSQRTGDWLSRQLDDMRLKLERSEDALQAYARQTGLMFTSEKTNVSDDKLKQLQEELSKAQADRMAKQSRYELTRSATPDTLPDVLNDSNLRDVQTKLTDLRRQEAELSTTYKADYTKVKRIQAQIASLETALERERAAILSRIRNEFEEAQHHEELLAAAYGSQAQVVTHDSEKEIQYNILKREVESNRQLYEAMLQRVKESAIASAMKASNVRVVDAAKMPGRPYKPSLPDNAGLGLLAGGFLGIAFVVMRERANRTLQQPGDAPFLLNVPELGAIPNARASSRNRMYYLRNKETAAEGSRNSNTLLTATGDEKPGPRERVELVTLQRRPSMVAEAFRTVLTSILFSGENGSRPRVLAITSPGPYEGKTTVTSNLAIALAEIGRKVLLIDADLRRPRIHEIFRLDNEVGLASLLREAAMDKATVDAAVRETAVPNLFALPSGPATSAAASLLFSPHMQELLKRFKGEFDTVLIDTPPTLQMPDARVIGRLADAVVLVTRANHTTRDAAVAARQRFSEDQTRVLGTILNDWDPRLAPNGYYGYYKGYYHGGYKSYYSKSSS